MCPFFILSPFPCRDINPISLFIVTSCQVELIELKSMKQTDLSLALMWMLVIARSMV
jgi:hypothetical protein